MSHAEPLFLVNDKQSERPEFNILLKQLVGTDDDIRLAALDIRLGVILVLLRNEP